MNIWSVLLFSLAAIIIYYILYKKTRDLLNPTAVMIFISLIIAAISQLNLGIFQTEWSKQTYYSISLSAISMTIASLLFVNYKRTKKQFLILKKNDLSKLYIPLSKNFHKIFYIWAALCYFAAIWTTIEKGFDLTYIFKTTMIGDKGQWSYSKFKVIEYLAGMLPHISIIAFFEIIFSRYHSKREIVINSIIIIGSLFFSLFVMVSRGTALIQILGYIYIINRNKRLSFLTIGKYISIILLIFGIFSLLRWQDHSVATVYSGKVNSIIFNSIYNYIAYCYQNFDTLVKNGSPYTIYKYVFMPITKILGTYNENDIVYISVAGFNAAPSIFGYYHDLGNIGIVLYSSIVIMLLSKLYNLSNRNEAFSLIIAMFQKGVFSVFFGDYILLFNGQILPMLITYFIILFNHCENEKEYYSYNI